MLNLICGILAMVVASLFIGGLALSIWDKTGSIAFPVIAAVVLTMAYIDFLQSLWEERRKDRH